MQLKRLLSRKDRVSVSEYNHNKNNQLIKTLLDFISEKKFSRPLSL